MFAPPYCSLLRLCSRSKATLITTRTAPPDRPAAAHIERWMVDRFLIAMTQQLDLRSPSRPCRCRPWRGVKQPQRAPGPSSAGSSARDRKDRQASYLPIAWVSYRPLLSRVITASASVLAVQGPTSGDPQNGRHGFGGRRGRGYSCRRRR